MGRGSVRAVGGANRVSPYFVNRGFLRSESQLLDDVPRIRHIPTTIVQGRYDIVCPATSAWDLHRAWPEADMRIVPDAGHPHSRPAIHTSSCSRPIGIGAVDGSQENMRSIRSAALASALLVFLRSRRTQPPRSCCGFRMFGMTASSSALRATCGLSGREAVPPRVHCNSVSNCSASSLRTGDSLPLRASTAATNRYT
jgi:hypothetical protein